MEFQHPTLRATFVRREFDDLWKIEGDSSDPDFSYADSWFEGVVEPEHGGGGGGGENP